MEKYTFTAPTKIEAISEAKKKLVETENNLKSSNIDKKMELELMLFNIFMIK